MQKPTRSLLTPTLLRSKGPFGGQDWPHSNEKTPLVASFRPERTLPPSLGTLRPLPWAAFAGRWTHCGLPNYAGPARYHTLKLYRRCRRKLLFLQGVGLGRKFANHLVGAMEVDPHCTTKEVVSSNSGDGSWFCSMALNALVCLCQLRPWARQGQRRNFVQANGCLKIVNQNGWCPLRLTNTQKLYPVPSTRHPQLEPLEY